MPLETADDRERAQEPIKIVGRRQLHTYVALACQDLHIMCTHIL